jgi:hypothetical protein
VTVRQSQLIFFILLFGAAILRVALVWNHPLGYDELSAVFRASTSSWQSHIQNGVMPDGHPPGLQTWLWFWINTFGDDARWLKIQAVLAGLLSAVFLWLAIRNFNNSQTATIAIAIFLFSPLSFHWSMQVRPYVFGMAIIALLFWQVSRLGKNTSVGLLNLISLGFTAALCAYLHYFAGLTALLILIFSRTNQKLSTTQLSQTLLIAALFFSPALPVFFNQLKAGGLAWLGKPQLEFIPLHIKLISGGSLFSTVLLLATAFLGYFSYRKKKQADSDINHLLLLVFWFIPVLTGFIWSVYYKPVLQHSVLLFSMPFWIMSISVGVNSALKQKKIFIWLVVFLALEVFSLQQRKTWGKANLDAYFEISKNLHNLKVKDNLAMIFFDGPEDIFQHHWKALIPKLALPHKLYKPGSNLSNADLKVLLDTLKTAKKFGIGLNSGTHAGLIPLLEDNIAINLERDQYPFGEYISFSKKENQQNYLTSNYSVLPLHENSAAEIVLKELGVSKNDVIVLKMNISDSCQKTEIISTLQNGENVFDWRSTAIKDWSNAGFEDAYHFIKLADIPQCKGSSVLKILIQNAKNPILYVRVSRGNPLLYGTFEN